MTSLSPTSRYGLGRIEYKDERNRLYGVRGVVGEPVPTRGRAWRTGTQLDQGNTPHCGGFSASSEAAAAPVRLGHIDNAYGHAYYYEIKDRGLDPWGREEGTSTNAVLELGRIRGLWESYTWGFSIDDVKRGLVVGPGLLGIQWFTGMFYPNEDNVIEPTGSDEGGHLLIIRRWTPSLTIHGKRYGEAYHLRNSWNGDCNSWLTRDGLEEVLIQQRGEFGIPVNRHVPPRAA